MSFACNLPLNPVSFGQVSLALLREMFSRNLEPDLFPIGPVELQALKPDEAFSQKLQSCLNNGLWHHNRSTPVFKLWHLNGGLESFSEKQVLMTFYELDSPTREEINIVKNNKAVILTSSFSKKVFEFMCGATNVHYVPLAFDSYHFYRKDTTYFTDGRIVFNLAGKLEKRKHHLKVLSTWAKRFGNNPKYCLQCAIYNQFLNNDQNTGLIAQALENKSYGNINFLGLMQTNELYNDYLNSGNIVIGMSGGEGFGLPEFQSLALGKHGVILNAHAYKDWATPENAVLINPMGKIPAYDGLFFRQGGPFNQGSIFDWDANEFIAGCEEAIKRFEKNPVNEAGLKLAQEFTFSRTLDGVLKVLES